MVKKGSEIQEAQGQLGKGEFLGLSKQKKSGWPSFWAAIFMFTVGMFLRAGAFDKVSLVYISGVFTVFILPYLLQVNEDKELMKQTKELVEKLGGEK